MLASQLIYTACGKDKTGAFSVWAKSADISKAESDEITKMMLYKRPADLPYEPTEEELNTLFPKKIGYFTLSSGRYCLAQAAYIGKVYSDLDMRSGNYIIHAFVMDNADELLPMTYIGSDVFKTSLTYEEWHENDAPETLPQVDLSEKLNGLSKPDIDAFFDSTNCYKLELLLQSVIDSINTGDKVTFYDKDANLKYWYKAISLCLPRSMQNKVTFCSFYTPTPPVPTQSMASTTTAQIDVQIRNVLPTVMTSVYSYAQDVRNGKKAFDFENNIINENIVVSRYVKTIVCAIKENLFNALMMVDTVEKFIRNFGCTVDQAASLYCLQKGNHEWFADVADLTATIELAEKATPDSLNVLADRLYDDCIQRERFECSPNILSIYRFVFDYSDKADKALIVEKYIEKHNDFGISDSNKCDEYCSKMIENAPFLWVNFVDYIFEQNGLKRYFAVSGDSFNTRYLIYITLVDALKDLSDEQKEFAYKYFLELMVNAIRNESTEQFDSLLNGIKKLGEKWETWLVKNAITTLLKNGSKITDVCNPDFLLNLVKSLSNQQLAILVLKQLAKENVSDNLFVAKYVAKADTARDKFEQYEVALRNDEELTSFVDNVEMYRFSNKVDVSKNDLNRYYRYFYYTGKDTGLFKNKLVGYLKKVESARIIEECYDIYSTWFVNLPDTHLDILECLSYMSKIIFDIDFEYLIKYTEKRGMNSYTPILKRIYDNGMEIPSKYYVLKLGMDAKSASAKSGLGRVGASKRDTIQQLSDKVFYKALNSQAEIDIFVKFFLTDVVNLYLEISARKEFEYVLEDCFEALVDSKQFAQGLFSVLEELDRREFAQFITNLFSYAFGQTTHLAERLRRIINSYLDDIGRGRRKKVFAIVTENVLSQYKKNVCRFIEKYQKEHETLFDKIFGGNSKNDNDREDKKQWKK